MEKLKDYIKVNNLTIEQFAVSIGKTRQSVHSWLSGSKKPDLESAVIIDNITKGKCKPKDWV